MDEYADVFTEELKKPTTTTVTHRIRLTTDEAFRIRPYRYSPEKKTLIGQEVTKMLEAGMFGKANPITGALW